MPAAPKKTRVDLPQAVRNKILDEYNHKCCICGAEKPQVHHIDEDPSNNDPLNLIPICPNCHLNDQHNPTRQIEPAKLRLFRQYKDPAILKPQFHPLFLRLRFLDDSVLTVELSELAKKNEELCEFIAALEMGSFYSKQISKLVTKPRIEYLAIDGQLTPDQKARKAERELEYRKQLLVSTAKVYSLAIELLRFQKW